MVVAGKTVFIGDIVKNTSSEELANIAISSQSCEIFG